MKALHHLIILNCFILALFLSANIALAEPVKSFGQRLADAALDRTQYDVRYDGRYIKIPYPNGDVPENIGVCTDLVVRAYRKLGIDLQKRVHLDMTDNFDIYPQLWGLTKPDTNIDHRRVPNLRVFFTRYGESLAVSRDVDRYKPGDLVTWTLAATNLPHIGIVSDRRSADGLRPLIIHNVGQGPKIEDFLFEHTITGHYRYYGH